ncbi:hypothetical protein FHU30_003818 [Actinomadura rupiterrae]|nr:hypothetical protein [Actinomadura rupiterrae]
MPTYQGATLSGLAYTTGDVDGIFRGGPNTYTRDLQWKTFLPAAMTMDGWAPSDKQPWRYGEPYTSINRKYLLLRERLLPYAYTFAAEAHRTGVGATRPLALEYPKDPQAWKAGQEFLSGTDFLVAPVTADASSRDGIYLPKGTWTDYWTGRTYQGPVTLDHYKAPLDTLPLFVRAGAVVPMWPKGTTSWQTRDKSRLSLDVYPQGHSSFTAYEDDGATRQFEKGSYATQTYTVDAPKAGRGDVRVRIDAPKGSYSGMPNARAYELTVHTGSRPKAVLVNGKAAPWSYADGVVSVSAPGPSTVTLRDASAVGGLHPEDAAVEASIGTEPVVAPGGAVDVPVAVKGHAPSAKVTLDAPTGWTVTPRGAGSFHVQAPANATPQAYDLTANVTYVAHGTTYTVRARGQVHVPYASLAAAYNNVGVTDDSNTKPGDFDGYKRSFSNQALAAAGITPGGQVKALGATFTWPTGVGIPDNVRPNRQTVPLTGTGSALAILGSGAGPDLGGVTLHYADGTSERRYFGFPHWGSASGLGATQVVKLPYRNNQAGKDNTAVYLFANEVPLAAGKKLVAVTLPTTTSTHVFSLALK